MLCIRDVDCSSSLSHIFQAAAAEETVWVLRVRLSICCAAQVKMCRASVHIARRCDKVACNQQAKLSIGLPSSQSHCLSIQLRDYVTDSGRKVHIRALSPDTDCIDYA